MNVVVTCGGGFQGLTICKELSTIENVQRFLLDVNAENCSNYFFDYHAICPPAKEEERYVNFLYSYCDENKIDFVIPATAYDLTILASLKTKFLEKLNCRILVPNSDIVSIFLNKKNTYSFLFEKGIKVQTALNPLDKSAYPIIGKLATSWGGKGIHVFKNATDFIEAKLKNVDAYCWLKYIDEFDEYSIDFSVNEQGIVSKPIIRKRNFVSGGFAIVAEIVAELNEPVLSEIEKIIAVFGDEKFLGVYNVQLLSTANSVFVSDVNTRMGTSAVFGNKLKNNLLKHVFGVKQEQNHGGNLPTKVVRFLDEKYFYKIDSTQVKAVVFDLDDTLISNKNFILERCTLLFEHFAHQLNNYQHFMILVVSILNEGKAPILIDEICREYQIQNKKEEILTVYQTCFPKKISVYSDVASTFKSLYNSGYKLFILTDNPLLTQQKKIEHFPYLNFINKVYYTDSLKSSKPSLQVFDLIKNDFGFTANELVMVGDNLYRDCIGAINAGYSYSFLIKRKDGMVSSVNNIDFIYDKSEQIIEIDSLHDLTFYLQ